MSSHKKDLTPEEFKEQMSKISESLKEGPLPPHIKDHSEKLKERHTEILTQLFHLTVSSTDTQTKLDLAKDDDMKSMKAKSIGNALVTYCCLRTVMETVEAMLLEEMKIPEAMLESLFKMLDATSHQIIGEQLLKMGVGSIKSDLDGSFKPN